MVLTVLYLELVLNDTNYVYVFNVLFFISTRPTFQSMP